MDLSNSISVAVVVAGVDSWVTRLEKTGATDEEVSDMFEWIKRAPHWAAAEADTDTLTMIANRRKLVKATERLDHALQPYLGTVEKTEELLRKVDRRNDPESAEMEIIKILKRFLHRQGFIGIAKQL